MSNRIYELIHRIRSAATELSRNRNFFLFETPEGRQALRIHRLIKSIEENILRHGSSNVEISTDSENDTITRVEVKIPDLKARQVSYLNDSEMKILRESKVGHLL